MDYNIKEESTREFKMKKGGKRSNTKIHPWSTRNKSMCSASHKT